MRILGLQRGHCLHIEDVCLLCGLEIVAVACVFFFPLFHFFVFFE